MEKEERFARRLSELVLGTIQEGVRTDIIIGNLNMMSYLIFDRELKASQKKDT